MAWDDAPPSAAELKTTSWDATPPSPEELKTVSGTSKKQTMLEQAGNALTFGYLPQLQAAASKPIYAVLNKLTGQKVEPDSYVEERDANIARLRAQQEANPKTALGSQVGGALLGAAITPGPGAAKGLMSAIGKGAAYGAGVGALSNPGDTQGVVDPVQAKERLSNAQTGAVMGGVAGGVAQGASKALGSLGRSSEKASDIANTQAVRGAGAMLKDFRVMNDRGQTQKIGRFMLDNGLIKAGDKVDDVAEKAAAFNKDAGQRLDAIYTKAVENGADSAKAFNPVDEKEKILKAIKDKLGNDVDKKGALTAVGNYFDQLAEDHGIVARDAEGLITEVKGKPISVREAQDIKTAMDQKINYSRNPLSKEPAAEKGFSVARQYLSKRIDEDVDAIGKASGNEGLLKELKDANRDYGYSAQVKNMAQDRIGRNDANRIVSLTDTIAGGAGGAAGSAIGSMMGGGDYHSAGEGALLGGLLAGGANHLGRVYGPGALAGSAYKLEPALRYTADPVGRLGSQVSPGLLMKTFSQQQAAKRALEQK